MMILTFLRVKNLQMYTNDFCDAGQVPILRYFEACIRSTQFKGSQIQIS